MNTFKSLINRFWQEEDAQDLVEYSLLMAFIALTSIALLTGTGGTVKNVWTRVNTSLTSAAS